jgi:4-hydroxy-tetrahydrodipicolinate reductase
MNIAIIGYGRMGHEIEEMAVSRGHSVKLIVDQENQDALTGENLSDVDVAIEFTSPGVAWKNIATCLNFSKPVVSGTTGWLKDYGSAVKLCIEHETSFIHAPNFSVGVNILLRLNSELAGIMSRYKEYRPMVEEIHHIKKLDSPSGTAISLADGIGEAHGDYKGWCSWERRLPDHVPVRSVREGTVPGTHTVEWDSEIDTISLKHTAKGRKGFAYGALLAAEFIFNRKGVFTMTDVLGF